MIFQIRTDSRNLFYMIYYYTFQFIACQIVDWNVFLVQRCAEVASIILGWAQDKKGHRGQCAWCTDDTCTFIRQGETVICPSRACANHQFNWWLWFSFFILSRFLSASFDVCSVWLHVFQVFQNCQWPCMWSRKCFLPFADGFHRHRRGAFYVLAL